MQLKKTRLFPFFFFLSISVFAQPTGLNITLKKSFFTLRNARFSIGANASTNFIFQNQEENKRYNIFNFSTNKLPDDYRVDFAQEDFPYFSGGVLIDLFSPNSILGLSLGAEYNLFNYGFTLNDSPISTIKTQQVRFPAYLKFLTGGIHDQISGVIMGGGYYTLPISFERNGPNDLSKDRNELASGLSASTILGIQYRFFEESDQIFEDVQGSKIWLYLRIDYSLFTPLADPALLTILQASNGDFSVRPLNLSIGLGYFL